MREMRLGGGFSFFLSKNLLASPTNTTITMNTLTTLIQVARHVLAAQAPHFQVVQLEGSSTSPAMNRDQQKMQHQSNDKSGLGSLGTDARLNASTLSTSSTPSTSSPSSTLPLSLTLGRLSQANATERTSQQVQHVPTDIAAAISTSAERSPVDGNEVRDGCRSVAAAGEHEQMNGSPYSLSVQLLSSCG